MSKESTMTNKQKQISAIASESRRNFVRGLSSIVGTTIADKLLSGNSLSVAMTYSLTSPSIESESLSAGKVFSLEQLKLLKNICAIVIPKTNTLGAAEVNTHGFIDNQLFHCYEPFTQEKMKRLLTLIDNVTQEKFSSLFTDIKKNQQFQLLTELDTGKGNFEASQQADFKVLKQLICFGYYTSEVGASKELRYLAVPGVYQGSIPYNDSEPSWGSKGLHY